ncbi:DNA polymerase III subunit alpha [bacterium HR40]|nr:DNA polymerase III subunit alpha [bacterium HR40]
MSLSPFLHLRVRSAHSLLRGCVRHDELVRLCRELRMPAVAVTDDANLFGVMGFCAAATKAGIQPVVGASLPLALPDGDRRPASRHEEPPAVVLLVQNATGYANLCRLLSDAWLDATQGRPAVSVEQLAAASSGLILLTGGAFGPVGSLLRRGEPSRARQVLEQLARSFPDRLYVELQRHGLPEEEQTEEAFLDLAYRLDLPIVATNDVHFADADMYEAHAALLCIGAGTTLDDPDRPQVTPEHRFKSGEEMAALFADLPEAIENTLVIARRCAFAAPVRKPILPRYPTAEGRNEAEELRVRARAGLQERLERQLWRPEMSAEEREEVARPYRERLEYELDVIVRMEFPGYFLIVADFIRWAKERGIPVGPGRGSGAGSLVAWALAITDLDPLRFGLLFERFLNPERVSMPDFDIDFCQDRRDEVIRYVRDKYGADRVAHIITFGRLQARAVLRDVGRVLGLPYGLVDRVCKLVPHSPANPVTLAEALELEPRLAELRDSDPDVARMIAIASRLEGLPRHASTHAAGVVIGDRPLVELIPLYRDPHSDMPVTQFDMKDVEKAGLVKFDFLGLTTLTMLRMGEDLLRRRGLAVELAKVPLDDGATYELLGRADTMGVFQLESGGMRDALARLRPDRFEDIIAMVALYRPGPMDNIPRYIAVKHGVERPSYLHPALEPILRETNGVIIYQEQVMEIARTLAGYTLGGADLLRRAMGKKIKAEMDAQREVFVRGAMERGIPEDLATAIFDQVAKFASYGFNKSHAAAYALLAYQTAWLKANHPAEFYASVLTMEKADQAKIAAYRQEMRSKGIPLYPPDVQHSGATFGVEEGGEGRGVRFALSAIKGIGDQAAAAIVAERERAGPFRSFFEFARRLGPRVLNRRILEALVRAGAFDSLDPHRARLFEAIEAALHHARAHATPDPAVATLFGGDVMEVAEPALPQISDWPLLERLQHEQSVLGFHLSAHPLDGFLDMLPAAGFTLAARLFDEPAAFDGRSLRLAGVVVARQERRSQRGRFAFVTFSDPSGQFEVTVFSDLFSRSRELLEGHEPLAVDADCRVEEERVRLVAQRIEPLSARLETRPAVLEIVLERAEALPRLGELLQRTGSGRGARVRLRLPTSGQERVVLELPAELRLPLTARADVARIPGVAMIRDLAG